MATKNISEGFLRREKGYYLETTVLPLSHLNMSIKYGSEILFKSETNVYLDRVRAHAPHNSISGRLSSGPPLGPVPSFLEPVEITSFPSTVI
mgnify:CR=1 FL=1